MAGSVNKVILICFLGRDPEIKVTTTGSKIANLTVATSESWKDKGGEKQEKTEWHRVVIYNQGIAEVVEKYLTKGAKVYIEGSLQTRKWTDKEGKEQRTTEIVLTQFKGELTILDFGDKKETKTGKNNAGWESYSKEKDNQQEDDKIPFD